MNRDIEIVGVRVRAFPRIHISLIDLAGATFRRNGGAGFGIEGPALLIAARRADQDRVELPEHFDATGRAEIEDSLHRLRDFVSYPATVVTISEAPPQHIGLGVKTCAILGALQAVVSTYGVAVGPTCLQQLSGRGGTSGIGISAFFCGGFITDSGHQQRLPSIYRPSSAGKPDVLPTPLVRLHMPAAWTCHLLLPEGIRRSGESEARFFEENTPITEVEVLEVMAAIYHGVCPAVVTADLTLLRKALAKIQSTGFKRQEIAGQTRMVQEVITALNEMDNVAVGMSSMGPLVYAIAHDMDHQVEGRLRNFATEFRCQYLGHYRTRNAGFEIIS